MAVKMISDAAAAADDDSDDVDYDGDDDDDTDDNKTKNGLEDLNNKSLILTVLFLDPALTTWHD